MKVAELIKQLEKIDPKLELFFYCEEEVLRERSVPVVLGFDAVDVANVETHRDDEGFPQLTFVEGDEGRKVAIMTLLAQC